MSHIHRRSIHRFMRVCKVGPIMDPDGHDDPMLQLDDAHRVLSIQESGLVVGGRGLPPKFFVRVCFLSFLTARTLHGQELHQKS